MSSYPFQLRQQNNASSATSLLESTAGSTRGFKETDSISNKFSLSADPAAWGSSNLYSNVPEADDALHNPDAKRDRTVDHGGTMFTARGLMNLGCLAFLAIGLVTLFAGYPLTTYFLKNGFSNFGGFNIGGINASGQIPEMAGNWALIDIATPKDAYSRKSYTKGKKVNYQLVFSDEFNVDGRTFYPGDDPYWEAVDLHYWATNNMEWYDPQAITTKNGALEIKLERKETWDLHYQGGMMSTWNKFCFTGGLVETAVTLPGPNNVQGLWPAIWMMGNLGRAGYGASLDGMWPYTYDSCDVGTAPNQTVGGLPVAALSGGDPSANDALSFLPGQRLSRCTCPGEEHPGPVHADGTYVGRAAPEIDFFEAQGVGHVSQSGQWAPFNAGYDWFNTSDNLLHLNSYKGGAFQQATSVVTATNQDCYEVGGNQCFAIYGVEYKPGFDDAYMTWINDGKPAWTLFSGGLAADTRVEIGARPVPLEPMYLIMNLGQSKNFGFVDEENLPYPVTMRVDYIRVYQPEDEVNVGCDPKDFPTAAYINKFAEAYTNPNLTIWTGTKAVGGFGQKIPRNKLVAGGCPA
ncbi:beta-glucan synthesis-associated protein [Flagelloscypha sp. PMI_526]|nr:beta-glucan synthesis-associated protein [Flagelloscypha sp. PMI_526]